ncbi:sigma 54-interacting transcriptional regulator, partial [Escherichia sp. TWPC-MK]
MQQRRPVRRALLSVSDKAGIVEFAQALSARGVELLSTGGTARLLAEKGLPVTEVSDEIGDISPMMQVRLLRAIQEREVQRVGSNQTISVDVRLIAATHRDLAAEVNAGRFRQDLYYRLNVVAIEVPSLRQRREDIPLLAGHFLQRFAERNRKAVKGFTPQAMDLLIHYDWPGN